MPPPSTVQTPPFESTICVAGGIVVPLDEAAIQVLLRHMMYKAIAHRNVFICHSFCLILCTRYLILCTRYLYQISVPDISQYLCRVQGMIARDEEETLECAPSNKIDSPLVLPRAKGRNFDGTTEFCCRPGGVQRPHGKCVNILVDDCFR
jgi:hypothetical protein